MRPAVRATDATDELLGTPAMVFGDRALDVADLVLIGTLSGTWPAFLDAAGAGVALEAACEPPPAAEIRAAATAFRYERGLLSAAEFVAWLRAAGLEASDLAGVLRRAALRARHPPPEDRGDVAPILRAELICSGTMGTLIREATDRLAAQRGLGDDAPLPDPDRLATLKGTVPFRFSNGFEWAVAADAALVEFARRVAEPEAVRRRLADHRLDWLRVTGEEAGFAGEGAAREARLLVAEGMPLADVARLARCSVAAGDHLIGSAPPAVAGALASAAAGEVVGPWEQDGEWRLLVVAGKAAPHLDDPELHERAARELLADALARLAAGQVRRHVAV